MKLIAGLGNPGKEYENSKHNVGWWLLDALAEHLNITGWRERDKALVAETQANGEKIILVKPLTYMNESGLAVGALMRWYKLDAEDLIVLYDDMDLPTGKIRIRKKGSAGGHNGMKSVINHVGSENFPRVRIGIGRPPGEQSAAKHVLSNFSEEEAAKVKDAVNYLVPAIECMLTESIDNVMNKYQRKRRTLDRAHYAL